MGIDDPNRCHACGAELDADADAEGLCSGCLLKLALPESCTEQPLSFDEPATTEISSLPLDAPSQIGPYRILQKLGEGGMGEVYWAEQDKPIRRDVALKLIKAGMDTRQVVARFESERQALALMNHPNIARVFDAGATEHARPYFVMEYVRGVPIIEYCDKHRLTTPERLALFIHVCAGVQHAHQRGIIHRDIKPSNVLVTVEDDRPVPKIIDFGVAKATAQRLTEKSIYTQIGVLVGTPEYMSPEQAELTVSDIDTRTDVYSLGVLLYELLIGVRPLRHADLRKASFTEICRMIQEDQPAKPSTRLTSMGDASIEAARLRKSDPLNLARELRGDLDWITMKALEKDRSRRYASPNEFAADIDRHLRHEPVLAGPPSVVYRTRKFVRRHRVGVAAVGFVAVALVLGLVSTAYGLVRATRAESATRIEAGTAEQVSSFLVDLFEVSDPSEARGNTITAREILDAGVERIEVGLADEPRLRARLLDTIGRVYSNLGLLRDAEPLLRSALTTRQEILGHDHGATLATMRELGNLLNDLDHYDEAKALLLEAIAIHERLHGNEDPQTLEAKNALARVYYRQGRYDDAEKLYLATLETQWMVLGKNHPSALSTMYWLGLNHILHGQFDDAESLLAEALDAQRQIIGVDHPDTLRTALALARAHESVGRYDQAEELYLETLRHRQRVLGPDHPETMVARGRLAYTYFYQGRLDDAESILRELLERRQRVLGPHHRDTVQNTFTLGYVCKIQGRLDEAESLTKQALEKSLKVHGLNHVDTMHAMHNLGEIYVAQGRLSEAEEMFLEVLEVRQRELGEKHPNVPETLHTLANLRKDVGDYEGAQKLSSDALRICQEHFEPSHWIYKKILADHERFQQELDERTERDQPTSRRSRPR
jgi:non-specific serine/threonine protein kinase/serine/threonine-protein kinase